MTTNLHDKMLAAIDAYFSASRLAERDQAEEQLLDVRDEINKYKLAAESLNEGLRLDDWDKIGCVNHDCDKCKAQQEPLTDIYRSFEQWKNGNVLEHGIPRTEYYSEAQLDLVEMGWKYGYDAGLAEQPAQHPEGDVVGPCVCGSWPGGKCLKCPRIEQPAQQWLMTDEMVTAAARALNKRQAEACGVDKNDHWTFYGDDIKEDARAVLEAAHGITKGNT